MTFDSTTTTGDQTRIPSSSESKGEESQRLDVKSLIDYNHHAKSSTTTSSSSSDHSQSDQDVNANNPSSRFPSTSSTTKLSASATISANHNNNPIDHHQSTSDGGNDEKVCYNKVLDDEIRSRLDRLNALSDLINSLERQFDESNNLFRETLKCSSDRLSSIAKTLGTKSIRQGRVYNAAKVSVEQSQSDCQKACVQFEQANKDHQIAKIAIREAEAKLREIVGHTTNGVIAIPNFSIEPIDISNLKLKDSRVVGSSNHHSQSLCDTKAGTSTVCVSNGLDLNKIVVGPEKSVRRKLSDPSIACKPNLYNKAAQEMDAHGIGEEQKDDNDEKKTTPSPTQIKVKSASKLSEELNLAIMRLIEADRKRSQSERQHLDRANKLMIAQENLIKLEREHGPSIRRSQVYFDEAKRFDAKLNSVKGDICRISEEILAAKQAYARTLSGLEQFSDELHDNSAAVFECDSSSSSPKSN